MVPLSIVRLCDGADLSRQAATKHLWVLAEAGLERGARQGRESRWALEPAPLAEARCYLDLRPNRWDEALGRLRELFERCPVKGRPPRLRW